MGQLAIYNQFYSQTNYIEYDRKGYSHHDILNENMTMMIDRMTDMKICKNHVILGECARNRKIYLIN